MSSGPNGLEILAQEHKNLLIAEVAGLLHDIGKFCDLNTKHHSIEKDTKWSNARAYKAVVDNPEDVLNLKTGCPVEELGRLEEVRKAKKPSRLCDVLKDIFTSDYDDIQNALIETSLKFSSDPLSGTDINLAQLIMLSMPGTAKLAELNKCLEEKDAWLAAALAICHGEAHHDKQSPGGGKQKIGRMFSSDVFGCEKNLVENLNARLATIPLTQLADRRIIFDAVRKHFPHGLGDTRRPVNEVTLWDWSFAVASLYKAAVAGALLTGQRPDARGWLRDHAGKILDHDFQWRLLRISFNGLVFLGRVSKLSDVLSRHDATQDALDRVRELLEVNYPLGNEIYRDENGSAFVVPALEGDDKEGTRIKGLVGLHISKAFCESKLEGEIRPHLLVSAPSRNAGELHDVLRRPLPPAVAFTESVDHCWRDERSDICTACGLRPQGWGAPDDYYRKKSQDRRVCYVCLGRRENKAKDWADEKGKQWNRTIWIDEVADRNGRLALLVGRFDLTNWLDGTCVQTMLVRVKGRDYKSKNPSFARLRRVWETTQQFWKTVQDNDIPGVLRSDRRRLDIRPKDPASINLGRYHVYDAEFEGMRLSLVWDPDPENHRFLTSSNLDRLARALPTRPGVKLDSPQKSANYVRKWLKSSHSEIALYVPGGYREKRRLEAKVYIESAEVCGIPYTPTIPILTEPSTFMTLVPADNALDVVARIKARFEEEMGKVRNRLPFFVGIVFFDRHQPLFSAMDAGRRMLKTDIDQQVWTVRDTRLIGNAMCEVTFTNGIRWPVPVQMGDCETPDVWYPYYRVDSYTDGAKLSGRKFSFPKVEIYDKATDSMDETPAENRSSPKEDLSAKIWIHVKDLAPFDQVKVTPARFAYLFLDTSARRFEAGQCGTWLLEHIDEMCRIWQTFKAMARSGRLTDTGLRNMHALFQTKRELWRLDRLPTDGETRKERIDYERSRCIFEGLVKTTLAKEGLSDIIRPDQVTSGVLTATIELYMSIMKDRLAWNQPA
jgi:hypothetical protein